jgi:hypothetical protein
MVIRGNYNQRQLQLEAIAIRGNQRQSQSEAIAIRGTQRHSEVISWALACCSASSWRESRSTSAAPWVSRGDPETARKLAGLLRGRLGAVLGVRGVPLPGRRRRRHGRRVGRPVSLRSSGRAGMGAAWAVAWVRAAPRAARLPRRARVYSPRRRRRAPARSELAHLMREAIKGVIRGHDDVHQAPREIGARSHRPLTTARRCAVIKGH